MIVFQGVSKHYSNHGTALEDVSFDVALRERSSVSSLIQISGRVNRGGDAAQAEVWDFDGADPLFTNNKSLHASRKVVEQAFRTDLFERIAGDVMTIAIQEEWKRKPDLDKVRALKECEEQWQFAEVAKQSQLLEDDTVTAIVDPALLAKLETGQHVRHSELSRGSVSIRKAVVEKIRLEKVKGLHDDSLYVWPESKYDSDLLGIMKYLLTLKDISDQSFAIV